MKFPDNWSTQKRKNEPLEAVRTKKTKSEPPQGSQLQSQDDVYNDIMREVYSGKTVEDEDLVLDQLLSKVGYRQLMQDLFHNIDTPAAEVPVISRQYEESYMREPMSSERPCIMNVACEGQHICSTNPFTLVEFLLPHQDKSVDRQMCVLCSRKLAKQLYYDMMYDGHRYNGVIQRYGNFCDQPGEYAKEAMLICPARGPVHNMPYPVVNYHRSALSVEVRQGVKHIAQHRVGFEDFQ